MNLKENLDLMLQDRYSSWSIVVIAYLVVTVILRRITFSQIKVAIKCVDREVYKRAKRSYFRESFSGWLLYLISVGFLMAYWFSATVGFFAIVPSIVYLVGLFLFFLFSLISHLKALFFGTIHSFHEKLECDEFSRHRREKTEG